MQACCSRWLYSEEKAGAPQMPRRIQNSHLFSVVEAFQIIFPVCKALPRIICRLHALHISEK